MQAVQKIGSGCEESKIMIPTFFCEFLESTFCMPNFVAIGGWEGDLLIF